MSRTLKSMFALASLVFLAFYIATGTRAAAEPQTVRVSLSDYHVDLSQFTVAPGKAVQFVVTNTGSLAHRLVIAPYATTPAPDAADAPVVGAGSSLAFQRTLEPGVYRVECLQWDHADRGMVNILAAEPARAPAPPWRIDLLFPFAALVFGAAYMIADAMR